REAQQASAAVNLCRSVVDRSQINESQRPAVFGNQLGENMLEFSGKLWMAIIVVYDKTSLAVGRESSGKFCSKASAIRKHHPCSGDAWRIGADLEPPIDTV